MPSRLINNAEHWRSRAGKMFRLAEYMTTQETKKRVLRIAAYYDEFARRAERGEHWRGRAEEMRTIADCARDRDVKDTTLRIAAPYDELANRAEECSENLH
jgi:hypothetical protein